MSRYRKLQVAAFALAAAVGASVPFIPSGPFSHVNWTRIGTIAALGLLAVFGRRHYRSDLNPVTLMALVCAGALIAEEIFLGANGPFASGAAINMVAFVGVFAVGATLRSIPPVTADYREVTTARHLLVRRFLPVVMVGCVVGLVFLARQVGHIYNSAGAQISNPVFDRSLVNTAIEGTQGGLIVRFATAYGILLGLPVGLYFVAGLRWRRIVLAVYGLGLIMLGSALRARLGVILSIVLTALVIALARTAAPKPPRRLRSVLAMAGLLVVVLLAFQTIYKARHGSTATTTNFVYSIAGGPSAMSRVVDDHAHVDVLGGRGVSLAGLLSLAGRHRSLGNFTSVTLSPDPTVASTINIYTGFQVLAFDLGRLGALFAFGLFGVVVEAAWLRLRRRPTPGAAAVTAVLLLIVAGVPVGLMTQYNFLWLALVTPLFLNRVFRMEGTAADRDQVKVAPDMGYRLALPRNR